jgi:purine nucleosidase
LGVSGTLTAYVGDLGIVTAMTAVFIDVDTGVDDALALIYLLASPDVELVGIASTNGNVAVQEVCQNNLGLLELCRARAVPVSKGADLTLDGRRPDREKRIHGPRGLGYADLPPTDLQLTGYDSATAWVRAAHAFPGELIGVVTGPLTNLALALRAEPALPRLMRRLVIMGGSYDHRGNITPVAEWNISVDPEAATEVLAAWSVKAAETTEPQRLPILCGLNLTRTVAMTPDILARLAAAAGSTPAAVMSEHDEPGTRSAASNPLLRVIEDATRFYLEAYSERGLGYLAYMHDPLAAAVALDPELVATRPTTVDIELTGTLTRGMTVTDWEGRWGREPNAQIGIDVDPAVFFERFIERVGPFARRLG